MPKACEALSVSGTNQVIAAQRVQIENYSTASRKHLIRTAKDVLESTLKVNDNVHFNIANIYRNSDVLSPIQMVISKFNDQLELSLL